MICNNRHNCLPAYAGFTAFTPTIPKFYWDVYSQEERIKAICCEIQKCIKYVEMMGVEVNACIDDVEQLAREFNEFVEDFEGQFQDYFNARVTEWLQEFMAGTVIDTLLKTRTFDTVLDMIAATDIITPCRCYCTGYFERGDSGSGWWSVETNSNATPNDMDIVNVVSDANTIGTRINDEAASPVAFGYSPQRDNLNTVFERMINLDVQIDGENRDYYISAPIPLHASDGAPELSFRPYNIDMKNMRVIGHNEVQSFFMRNTSAQSIKIKDCEFTGFKSDSASGYSVNAALPMNAAQITVERVSCHDNDGNGIMLYPSGIAVESAFESVLITQCAAYNNGTTSQTGIGIGSYLDPSNANMNVCIDNCIAYNNANSGIAPHGCNNVKITNCNSFNNREHGYVIQDTTAASISNCTAEGNSAFSLRIQGNWSNQNAYCRNVAVSNNIFKTRGILCGFNSSNITITNNVFTELTNVTAWQSVLMFDHPEKPCKSVLFAHNTIQKDTGTTFEIASAQPGNMNIVSRNNVFNGMLFEIGGCSLASNDNAKRHIINAKIENIAGASTNVQLTPNNATIDGNTITANGQGIIANSPSIPIPESVGKYICYYTEFKYTDVTNQTIYPVIRLRNSQGGLVTDMQHFFGNYAINRAGVVQAMCYIPTQAIREAWPSATNIVFALAATAAGAQTEIIEYSYSFNGML